MATITSAQTGSWHNSSTWAGGVVPNLSQDDVIIASGHTVTMSAENYVLANGHSITINSNGKLDLKTGLTIEDASTLTVYGALQVYASYTLNVSDSSVVHVYGDLYVNADAIVGVISGAVISIETGGDLFVYGRLEVSGNNSMLVIGNYPARFFLQSTGVVEVFTFGKIHFAGNGRSYLYGLLQVYTSGYLQVSSGARVTVYKHIELGGQMTGGGTIVPLRRETRINAVGGYPLFRTDRLYGYDRAMVG